MYICIYIKQHEVSIKYFESIITCKKWLKDTFKYTIKQRKFTEFQHIIDKDSNIYIKDVTDHIGDLEAVIKAYKKAK